MSALTEPETRNAPRGDYPARARIIVTDTSGNNQRAALWGFRSRHYDTAVTAALTYEAEILTPLNGASAVALTGASSGEVVTQSSLPAGVWTPILSTTMQSSGNDLTHQGSYRVWARCYSASAAPQFRLAWGVGSLANPTTNTAAALPGAGAFYLLDLGVVRLDAPPVGAYAWKGVIQAQAAVTGDPASVDIIYLQPLDEAAGQVSSVASSTPSAVENNAGAGTYLNNSSAGMVAWTISSPNYVYLTSVGELSQYLQADNYGFSIPSSATIQGIEVAISRQASGDIVDQVVRLMQAGAIVGNNYAVTSPPWPSGGAESLGIYGGQTDLWGTTWTPAQINAANFGVVLQVSASNLLGQTSAHANVLPITITVYYTLGTGLGTTQDAVICASGEAELRYDGMYRPDPATAAWAPMSIVYGDLARLPPSGIENRAVELLVKPSRGDMSTVADSALDGMSVQVKYRPCWMFRP